MKLTLEQLRQEIDRLDEQILPLLNRRAALAVEIGEIKQSNGHAIYVPSRERSVLQRLVANNQGPLSHRSICRIYAEIMAASLALEHKATVIAAGVAESDLTLAVRYVAGSHASLQIENDPHRLITVMTGQPEAFLVIDDAWLTANRSAIEELKTVWRGSWRIPFEGHASRYHLYTHAQSGALGSRPATVYGLVDAAFVVNGVPPDWIKQVPASSVEFAASDAETGCGIVLWRMELTARETRDAWLEFLSSHCRAVWIVS